MWSELENLTDISIRKNIRISLRFSYVHCFFYYFGDFFSFNTELRKINLVALYDQAWILMPTRMGLL